MLLTIHDMNLRKVASIDNDKQGTLNYFNDLWTRYLETGSSTFDFTVFKKAIKSDTWSKKAYNYLNEKSFISFEYEGETHLFTVRKVVENEKLIKCNCVNLNLELINEYANPYKATKAMTFKEYCQAMDLLNFTMLTIGLNELSDKKVSAEWEGSDTKLARLLSLASKFGAELEFRTFLNDDSTIKQFVVNVYQAADGNHLGVGKLHTKPLRYGKDFKTLTRTVDKTEIYNMVRPTGKDDQGNVITIGKLGAWSVKNDNGELEFYQDGESLYAPLSMQMYPAAFTSGTMKDQWIRKDMTVESSSPEVIRTMAYRELKKYAYPAVTYEMEGFTNLGIGDTVHVYDDGFSPALLLEMRVSEQAISFTNSANNKTTFANARALESKLSQGIQARIDQMLEEAKPYIIKLATDNGVIFKNQTGQTTITPTLYKGGKIITDGVTWRWTLNGSVTAGMTYLVKGSSVTDTVTLTVAAYIGNAEVAVDELSLVNVSDGPQGDPGPKGDPGTFEGSVGSRNYAEDYDFSRGMWEFSQGDSSSTTRDFSNGVFTMTTSTDTWHQLQIHSESGARLGGKLDSTALLEPKPGETYTLSVEVKVNSGDGRFWLEVRDNGLANYNNVTTQVGGFRKLMTATTEWVRYSVTGIWKPNADFGHRRIILGYTAIGSISFRKVELTKSSIVTDAGEAPEDRNSRINAKADSQLTQEQLVALTGQTNRIQANIEALAAAKALTDLEEAYKEYVRANDAAKKVSEGELATLKERTAKHVTKLAEFAEDWEFMNTKLRIAEEGIYFGKLDGSSEVKITDDRISFWSSKKEVMWITAGTLNIDNGIFTVSVQIGRFREEQYTTNPDINVIRYVG
jgi:phage minor structural protein